MEKVMLPEYLISNVGSWETAEYLDVLLSSGINFLSFSIDRDQGHEFDLSIRFANVDDKFAADDWFFKHLKETVYKPSVV